MPRALGINNALVKANGLSPIHSAFVDEYMRNGRNATKAYALVKGAAVATRSHNVQGCLWLKRPAIVAEIERRVERYARDAGIEKVKLLEFLRDAVFCDITEAFDANGNIRPPTEWSPGVKNLVAGYNSGTVTVAEKITFESRVDIAFRLLEELKPLGEKTQQPGTTNIQVNVDKLLMALDGASLQPE
jgi:hypothetical protein